MAVLDVQKGTFFTMTRVHKMYVLLSDNEDGREGLCMITGPGEPIPVLTTDLDRDLEGGLTFKARLELLMRQARDMARLGNRTVRVVRFTVREDVETFHADGRRERPA